MSSALLILTAREPAIFSERSATEGAHRTLAHPTGAALLGWAAATAPYADFGDRAFEVFHSGRVRFSNALPLTAGGKIAYPMPQLLMEEKVRRGGVDENGRLVPERIRIGRPPPGSEVASAQLASLGRTAFVSRDGEVFRAWMGSRLRTATESGRASEGQLFGYAHIEPRQRQPLAARTEGQCLEARTDEQRYAASLEADELADSDWERLLRAFRGRTLHLGRAAGTSYGGAYDCEVIDPAPVEVFPRGGVPGEGRYARIWALSDLALLDDHGNPTFQPTAEMLGLEKGARLNGAGSAIGVRRYSPWNQALSRRDVERQVIAAGSVLTFDLPPDTSAASGPGVIGLWREAGLGRVWIDPPLLRGEPGAAPVPEAPAWIAPKLEAGALGSPQRPSDPLAAWLESV